MSQNITKALPGLGVAPGRPRAAPFAPGRPGAPLARGVRRRATKGEEAAGEGSGPSDGADADQMARVNSRTATTPAATATRKKLSLIHI